MRHKKFSSLDRSARAENELDRFEKRLNNKQAGDSSIACPFVSDRFKFQRSGCSSALVSYSWIVNRRHSLIGCGACVRRLIRAASQACYRFREEGTARPTVLQT